jgi:hypothetical protein
VDRLLENLLIEAFIEEAALITEDVGFEEDNVRDFITSASPKNDQGRAYRLRW